MASPLIDPDDTICVQVGLGGLFPGLSTRAELTLLSLGHLVTLERDELFFVQGQFSSRVGIVLTGHLKLVAVGSSGRSTLLTFWRPGDILGLVSSLNDAPFQGSAQATEQARLWTIPVERFQELLEVYPEMNGPIVRQLSRWLGDSVRRQALQATESAEVRVAALMVDLCGTDSGRTGELAFELTQDEIAQLVGASRETVARILRLFREASLVSTARRRMVVRDLGALRRIAGLGPRVPGSGSDWLHHVPHG